MSTTLTVGDYGYYITFYLKEYDPITTLTSSFDLSLATTITFKAQKYGEDSIRTSGSCAVVTATEGICTYLINSLDFNSPGNYIGEVEVKTASAIVTWTNIHIVAEEQLPK